MMSMKYNYLNNPMKRKEYMRLKILDIPNIIIREYNLLKLVTTDRYNYCKNTECMACHRRGSLPMNFSSNTRKQIPQEHDHSMLLDTQDQTNMLYTGCQWLCHKIYT
jgi:hypothetical protein